MNIYEEEILSEEDYHTIIGSFDPDHVINNKGIYQVSDIIEWLDLEDSVHKIHDIAKDYQYIAL